MSSSSSASFTNLRPISNAWRADGTMPSTSRMPGDCVLEGIEQVSHSIGSSDLYECLRKSIQTDRLIVRHPALERQLVISSGDFQRYQATRANVMLWSTFTPPLTALSTKQRNMYLLEYVKTTVEGGRTEFEFTCYLVTIAQRREI
jgi:hypothetical protein